jgi:predicted nucleic acid-binding protein
VILVDTTVLVAAFAGQASLQPVYRRVLIERHRLVTSTLVLYEWLRGPRQPDELAAVHFAFPPAKTITFGLEEAARAAELYRTVSKPRRRETDLAIAATAMVWEADLWTLNPSDFRDVPGLRLFNPSVI